MDQKSIHQQKEFYNKLWHKTPEQPNADKTLRLAKILECFYDVLLCSHRKPLSICDLGAGHGWLANELTKFGQVTGIELSRGGVETARERHPAITFVEANILEYQTKDRFDVVVTSEVIEHIEEQHAFIDAANRLIAPNGWLILTCPNGRVRGHFPDKLPAEQPIEKWPTPKQLAALVRPSFFIKRHETFLTAFSNRGLLRIANSTRAHRLFKNVGLLQFFLAFIRTLDLGLYQIILARKRSKNV